MFVVCVWPSWGATLFSPLPGPALPSLPRAHTPTAPHTPTATHPRCNPEGDPQHTVELLNALAVKTVQAAGVTLIHDAYSAVTSVCGPLYFNCTLCDNEARYTCPEYQAIGGICGFHYTPPGWEVLANSTVTALRQALAQRRGPLAGRGPE